MRATVQHVLHPRPFEDGHALTFTVREVYKDIGEFHTQYHDRRAAFSAFSDASLHADYAELRDQDGRRIAWSEKNGKLRPPPVQAEAQGGER
jgi:hypothetical protein